jgi:restriction system protein
MTPREYEKYVCEVFSRKGYEAKLTPQNNDYGIDIFAYNKGEKIGIQAKMFGHTTRKVNRQMVMELHGAKDFFECDKAILVTNGEVLETANEVAKQLGVEILFLIPEENFSSISKAQADDFFENVWENYIKPLEGKTLVRKNGKSNKIIKVDWSGVERVTSHGRTQKIKIEIFRLAINKILSDGGVTRDFINQEYQGRASSGIVLLLCQVPFFKYCERPSRILFDKEKYKNKTTDTHLL